MLFNHQEIYEEIKNKYRQRGFDTEFGSNIQQIQNQMAYLVSMLNQNTQINVKETILSSQTKRNMILEDARLLGYEAIAKRSFQYSLTLNIDNNTGSTRIFRIPNYQKFSSGQNEYVFIENINLPNAGEVTIPQGEYREITVTVIEGKYFSYQNDSSLVHNIRRFLDENGVPVSEYFVDVPYTDVEENGLFVTVEYTDSEGNPISESWTRSDMYLLEDGLDIDKKKEFIRQDSIEYGTPRMYFRYQNSGTEFLPGTVVKTNVLVSKGSEGAQQGQFTYEEPYDDQAFTVSVIDSSIKINGSDEESDQSIKTNQPLFNNTQNRVITLPDYVAVQSRQTFVKHAQIWDGFEEFERVQGNIWFSFVPNIQTRQLSDTQVSGNPQGSGQIGTKWVLEKYNDEQNMFIVDGNEDMDSSTNLNDRTNLENSEVGEIFRYMRDYTIPTLVFNYRQPHYMNFDITVRVQQYGQQQSTHEANTDIFNQINKFFEYLGPEDKKAVELFDQKFFNSDLIDYIKQNTVVDTMFDIEVNNSVFISRRNVTTDQSGSEICSIRLGQEFVNLTPSGQFDSNALPNIETQNFYNGHSLLMPTNFSIDTQAGVDGVFSDVIKLSNGSTIGSYRVFTHNKTIEIYLNNASFINNLKDNTDGLNMNVSYPTPNASVQRNTIPRLNSVHII